MPRRETPQEKKAESYARDRRNTYGENNKSSRKNLPKARARPHRANRRAAHQALGVAEGPLESGRLEAASDELRRKRPKTFRKVPDEPLGEVLAKKRARRARRAAAAAAAASRKTAGPKRTPAAAAV